MRSTKKPSKKVYSLMAAIGLALGTMGVAAAATTPRSAPPVAPAQQSAVTDQGSATTDEAPEAEEAETPGDEAVDGVNHQFEGEEVGNNGDGVADADDANEIEEADNDATEIEEADEVEGADDEADDGVNHEFEGEETGNNGDGVADADDAAEAPASGTNG